MQTSLDLTRDRKREFPPQQINFGHSTKNKPICSGKHYMKSFIDKTEKFVKKKKKNCDEEHFPFETPARTDQRERHTALIQRDSLTHLRPKKL